MKYLKLFESYNKSELKELLVDILDKPNKYVIVGDDNFEKNIIEFKIVNKRKPTSENLNRCITGYFRKGHKPELISNKVGYLYEYMYKSRDTIEVVADVEDFCLKVCNFTEYDYCYFKLSGMTLKIFLGRELFRSNLDKICEFTSEYIEEFWGL